jgi:flavin-dependent dehydrogenase
MVRHERLPRETDVFVVGGGPAGLAAAIAVRQRGLTVIVADIAQCPIDKACGEGVMPDGVAALRRLGVVPGGDEAFPFHGISFIGAGVSAAARFPDSSGLGIRRTTLHRVLVERAAEAGVVMSWGTPVRGGGGGGVRMGDHEVRCRWVVGADGQNSRVRQWAGLEPAREGSRRVGFREHFRVAPWTDLVEVHWHRRCQAYVTPVRSREVCVALIGSDPSLRMADLPALFPDLGRRLKGARSTTPVMGGMSASRRLPSVVRDNVALVGDASGSVDAVTGEGLSLAFRQAAALGEALAAGDLTAYQVAHRRIGRAPELMAHLLLAMDGRTWLRHGALRALAGHPQMFTQLLAVHVGALPPTAIGLNVIAGFAWQLLTAGASVG